VKLSELTAGSLTQFFTGGCGFLAVHKESVDALNVFPVPDGDTGTNMSLTMNSAIKDLAGLKTVGEVANIVSMGALMGARGNSGVILSQLFRGFAQAVAEKKKISSWEFAHALQKGVELAYKSVMKPVEGTILTVSKAVANGVVKQARQSEDMIQVLTAALDQGQAALDNTPNQLPVLKQAGVVDAGGKGFLLIVEGGLKALMGETTDVQPPPPAPKTPVGKKPEDLREITYRYCTEFILKGDNFSLDTIRGKYQDKGDSMLVVGTRDMVKVHIHTNHPGEILEYALSLGTIHDVKIDNMKDQHRETISQEEQVEKAKCAVVTVAAGDGLAKIFSSLGVRRVINGGQTMNPSAEDLVNAIQNVSAEEVVVLPNNSNILLTAQQAQALSNKPVQVVPTISLAQGLAAMLAFEEDKTAETNAETMANAFAHVKTGEVTYAVRDSVYNGLSIKEKDILGLWNGSIKVTGQNVDQVVKDLVRKMVEDTDELITLFYGKDIAQDEANRLIRSIKDEYPQLDVEVHFGGQPVYYYLISIE